MAFELDSGVRQQLVDSLLQEYGLQSQTPRDLSKLARDMGKFERRFTNVLNNVQKKIKHVDAGTSSYVQAQSMFNFAVNLTRTGDIQELTAAKAFIGSENSPLRKIDPTWLTEHNNVEFKDVDSLIGRIDNRINHLQANILNRQKQQWANDVKAKMNEPEAAATLRKLKSEADTKRVWREDGTSYRVSHISDMGDLQDRLRQKYLGSVGGDTPESTVEPTSPYQKGSREYYKRRHELKHGKKPLSQEEVDSIIDQTRQNITEETKARNVLEERGAAINDDLPQVGRGRRDPSLPSIREGTTPHGKNARQIKKFNEELDRATGSVGPRTDRIGQMARDQAENADLDALNGFGTTDPELHRLQDLDDFISKSGVSGTSGRINKLRSRYGKEVNKATKEFNKGVDALTKKASSMRPADSTESIGDFILNNPELAEEYAQLQNTTFARVNKLEGAINQSLEDYASIDGNGPLKFTDKQKAQLGMAQQGRFGPQSQVQEATTQFTREVDGVKYLYEKNSTITRSALEDGSWSSPEIKDSITRRKLTTDAEGKIVRGDPTSISSSDFDDALKSQIEANKGRKIAPDAEGAIKTTTSVKHLNADGSPVKFGYMEGLDDAASVKQYARAYDKSDVAARISKTGAAEGSGIFSQIADAAAKHPGYAAAIAIGGFALASKALDRRREYD